MKEIYVCHKCGSDNVTVEARVSWSIERQCWDIEELTWSECQDCYEKGEDEVYGHYVRIEEAANEYA